VSGEDRYQYELRWGNLEDGALRNLRIVKCHHYYDSIAIGAQLKRIVEEAILAGQWAA
jgi:hypothetical protein